MHNKRLSSHWKKGNAEAHTCGSGLIAGNHGHPDTGRPAGSDSGGHSITGGVDEGEQAHEGEVVKQTLSVSLLLSGGELASGHNLQSNQVCKWHSVMKLYIRRDMSQDGAHTL